MRDRALHLVQVGALVLGGLGFAIGMHAAVTGLLAVALAHLLLGLVLMAWRHHRQSSSEQEVAQ